MSKEIHEQSSIARIHRDLSFLLHDVFGLSALASRSAFVGQDRSDWDAVLMAAGQLSAEVFAPAADSANRFEPKLVGERVETAPGLGDALKKYVEGGFTTLGLSADYGGLPTPYAVTLASQMIFSAADNPSVGYAFLTSAAARLLNAYGDEIQKQTFLEPLVTGRWFGTMCLSEPEVGSSLGDIRTKAIPMADNVFRIRGSKMWISGGDHELVENIVHFVLARIEGMQKGIRGLSLFIVPKYRVEPDGRLLARNDVQIVGLNHKLGHRATTNCALSFGENDACEGWLIGVAGEGLRYMFAMMNEARIGVGAGAAMTAAAAYHYSLGYAKSRRQGRVGKAQQEPSLIIDHADVRRMLLAQKAIAEGGAALCLYCAFLVDDCQSAADEQTRTQAGMLLGLLTPIAKSWPSERGMKANSLAIQVLGGAGYVRDHPVERLYRDQRLNPIHEGTTGIQAVDLLGRKIPQDSGKAMNVLSQRMRETIKVAMADDATAPLAQELDTALTLLLRITDAAQLAQDDVRARMLSNAVLYLEMFGDVMVAWMWLMQAVASASPSPFHLGKRTAARYFFRYELPRVEHRARLLLSDDDTVLSCPVDAL
jgi:butyryl-CoA dehydrogenase